MATIPDIQGYSDEHVESFQDFTRFIPMQFRKGDYLYRAGDICKQMFYISQGVTRAFYIHEDKEVNLRLTASHNIAVQYSSFISGDPSNEYIQCLTDCAGYALPLGKLENYRKPNADIDSYLRTLAENHYLAMEKRPYMLQLKSGKERYAYFMQAMPGEVIQHTPSQHIASYLGLTAESFSRIKRELNK